MSKLLNAVKLKFNHFRQSGRVRIVLISTLALLLICGVTLAWYINNLGLWGITFETGNIEFNAYVFDEQGNRKLGPVASNEEDKSVYLNAPLISIQDAQVGTGGTVYIAVESTGSIGIQYKVAFDVTGETENASAYLGGYKYTISRVSDKVQLGSGDIDVSNCGKPDLINHEMVTIDRNPVSGTIDKLNGYDIYRFDYKLVNKNEEYTDKAINIYFNIFATQIGGDFDDTEEHGSTYYCSTQEEIDQIRDAAYPGDTIKLSSNIVYYGDLVFNKPVHLEMNDFTLTVNGNLMYDYVLGNGLKIHAGGLGKIVVQCSKDGVGGNFKIKTPISDVALTGSNSADGDIVVEKSFTIDATNSYGAPGASLNNLRVVDVNNSRKTIMVESNSRVTVSFGTTVGEIQAVTKANNIEIINNGVIDRVNLSGMALLNQTNSPQIYILNNNDINSSIVLPAWATKFVELQSGACEGNTRIIQSLSGSPMTVVGSSYFDNDDIEIEKKNVLVEQIEEGNDSRLKIYYQDLEGQPATTIQSILQNYFKNDVKTNFTLDEVQELEIISIGNKAITNSDIVFMNGNHMRALKILDMQRANVIDTTSNTRHKLPSNAFSNVTKYEKLVLPQNLVEVGASALSGCRVENIVTVPAEVSVFGQNWGTNAAYIGFASSVPMAQAVGGLSGVDAIFVEEAYIGSYKSIFSNYSTHIYPVSVLDEAKQHFVRNTENDNWEITYHISGEDDVIGDSITINGKLLNITSVYANAYRHNFNTAKVRFADSVVNLGDYNFISNTNITDVDLNSIHTVGVGVFKDCSKIVQISFGSSLEVIAKEAFYGCVSVKHGALLPDTMKSIGYAAFQRTGLTMINTGGTETIDGRAFYYCNSLVYAELPQVTEIGFDGSNEVFAECSSLVSLSMPSLKKVTGIHMFRSCKSLRELYLAMDEDGISFGTDPFASAFPTGLKLFVPEEKLSFFRSKRPGGMPVSLIYPIGEKMGENLVNNFNIGEYVVLDNGDQTYSIVTSNITHSGDFNIPLEYNGKSITGVYDYAFVNQQFTDVKLFLGNNLKKIGPSAFSSCSGIEEIIFGNSLEVIGQSAFASCSNWSGDIILPASMKKIGAEAFKSSGITGINTGGTTSIDGRAFAACGALIFAELPEVTVIGENGTNELFLSCSSLVSARLPKLYKVSGLFMFKSCTSLREIYMSSKNAEVSLGAMAFDQLNTRPIKMFVPEEMVTFYKGRGILPAQQVFPQGVKVGTKAVNGFVIGDYILAENDTGYMLVASNLDFSGRVEIPSSYQGRHITEIYPNAFFSQSFTNASICLSEHVKVIGDGAFYNASGLVSVIMDGVTTVGKEAFYKSGLKVLNAPALTHIGDRAFGSCLSLTNVDIPRIVNIDANNVFSGCTSLKSVYFEDMMSLQKTTFSGCKQLEKITINRVINSNGGNLPAATVLESTAPCKIYVPYRSLSQYSATWSGKPVVTFDVVAKNNGNTYVLNVVANVKYELIDFIPSKSVATLTLPSSLNADSGEVIAIHSIRSGAFSMLSETLKEITLPSSLAFLDSHALSECTALENIHVNTGNGRYKSIGGVLYSNDGVMLVKFPAGRSGAFDMTQSNYASTFGISAGAFAGAHKLVKIVFPSSLRVIDSTAFDGCNQLKSVTFTGTTPPILMSGGIFDTDVVSFEMSVPSGSVNAYLLALNFSEYEAFIA